jgi:acyl-CoA oxidase
LNHGSYTRGIVTEAVYDPANEEFIIDSKGEEGMKFWIGGMAETANMTIMWAQLIVDGKNYGPHPFIMRIRDPNTHFVLPGIIIGDCGPKNGNNAIDNGYMMVKNVRIPKNNLLGKLGDIDKNGKYQSEIKNN